MSDLYAEIGVPKDATKAAIKAAYRRKAKNAHPDVGGSSDAFTKLSFAHRILTDDSLRQNYDATGKTDDPEMMNVRSAAMEFLGLALNQIISRDEAIYIDVVASLREAVRARSAEVARDKATTQKVIDRTKAMRKRFSAKGQDYLGGMLDAQIAQGDARMRSFEFPEKVLEQAALILADASFKVDQRPAQTGSIFFSTQAGGIFSR